jgi:hypothetical protein
MPKPLMGSIVNDMDGFVLCYILVIIALTMNDKNGITVNIDVNITAEPLLSIKIPTVAKKR